MLMQLEAMSLSRFEVSKFLGGVNFQLITLQLPLQRFISLFKFVLQQFTSSSYSVFAPKFLFQTYMMGTLDFVFLQLNFL